MASGLEGASIPHPHKAGKASARQVQHTRSAVSTLQAVRLAEDRLGARSRRPNSEERSSGSTPEICKTSEGIGRPQNPRIFHSKNPGRSDELRAMCETAPEYVGSVGIFQFVSVAKGCEGPSLC